MGSICWSRSALVVSSGLRGSQFQCRLCEISAQDSLSYINQRGESKVKIIQSSNLHVEIQNDTHQNENSSLNNKHTFLQIASPKQTNTLYAYYINFCNINNNQGKLRHTYKTTPPLPIKLDSHKHLVPLQQRKSFFDVLEGVLLKTDLHQDIYQLNRLIKVDVILINKNILKISLCIFIMGFHYSPHHLQNQSFVGIINQYFLAFLDLKYSFSHIV